MFKKSLYDKRGQMKIQQMAFMLVAVFIFFVLIGLAFLAVNMSGLEEKASELRRENARLLVSSLADSPEFSCGKAYDGSKSSCVDLDKAMALKGMENVYSGFWDVQSIEIRRVYPSNSSEECTSTNYPDCGKITVVSDSGQEKSGNFTSVGSYVTLCRKGFDQSSNAGFNNCDLGRLFVSYQNVG
ncbi:MAG: hypothetical protein ABEI74_03605 [Candidatus Pacearchaeota archaeon]